MDFGGTEFQPCVVAERSKDREMEGCIEKNWDLFMKGNEIIEIEEWGKKMERQEVIQIATGLFRESVQISEGMRAMLRIRGMGKDNF